MSGFRSFLRLPSCLVGLLFCVGLSLFHAEGSFPQQAYIWQRSWGADVADSLSQSRSRLQELTVLAAELVPDDRSRDIRVALDVELLKQSKLPLRLSVRIQHRPPEDPDWLFSLLHEELPRLWQQAEAQGLQLRGLEIDYDCPTSNLERYAAALRRFRARHSIPLSITTLPTWMSRREAFAALVHLCEDYVLQVHSVERPQGPQQRVAICDPDKAMAWIQQASELRKNFRVALPTYGVRVGFDPEGRLAELLGESGELTRRRGWSYQELRAEPKEMSDLVQRLQAHPPEGFQGLIWFRLPVGEERFNWDLQTWFAVMEGQGLTESWQVELTQHADGLIELQALQTSPLAQPAPRVLRLHWQGASEALAWDGQRQYRCRPEGDQMLLWEWSEQQERPLLPQGTRWTLGWLRFDTLPSQPLTLDQIP